MGARQIDGAAFRSWMDARGFDIPGAAEALGVSSTTIKMWRSGGTPIRRVHVLAIKGYDAEHHLPEHGAIDSTPHKLMSDPDQLELPEIEPVPRTTSTRAGKLSPDDVRAIRRRFRSGEKAAALAEEYGVQPAAIRRVAAYMLHRHIKDLEPLPVGRF